VTIAQNLFKAKGGRVRAENVRDPRDFYRTPSACVIAILRSESNLFAAQTVWDPAAGDAAMTQPALAMGYRVIASDLVRRDNDPTKLIKSVYDFDAPPAENCAVLMNPPFSEISPRKGGAPFLEHLFKIGIRNIVMLAPIGWGRAVRRQPLIEQHTPSRCWQLTWRPDWTGGGSSPMDMAFWVWTGEGGPTELKWLGKPDV